MFKSVQPYIPEFIVLIAGIFATGISSELGRGSGSAAAIGIASAIMGIIGIVYRAVLVATKAGQSTVLWVIGFLITLIGAVILYLSPDGILSGLVLYAGLAMLTSLFLHRS
ncbi:hypothetical protein Clow_02149 [Corynebacterium lowii]|uniref:Uncharacterized protein n=1 Tax=Corynebacterium lowii TaxID=1544413 RepID=A0A0Q0YNA7_9CORY|nr:hypothetical protein Clow_02149 [Corynebacterium lowii]MDP9852802.1 putative membrane protein YeaQ/YmgE (transglycosylase-associated protein family) [Corynebacterium lowii]